MSSMLATIPQPCPFTATSRTSVRPRNVLASASLHRAQAQQPLRLQSVDCAKEAKCTCGKTKRPPNCDGSHAKRSKAGFVDKMTPAEQEQLTAQSMLPAQNM
ncbi:g8003 [Coccomyxa viridis]|uniref:G8003 protein n=1 Tax=Coccomyxa viridis TaxID=1274662 RepID=A0ABP1G3R8_9CHLO